MQAETLIAIPVVAPSQRGGWHPNAQHHSAPVRRRAGGTAEDIDWDRKVDVIVPGRRAAR